MNVWSKHKFIEIMKFEIYNDNNNGDEIENSDEILKIDTQIHFLLNWIPTFLRHDICFRLPKIRFGCEICKFPKSNDKRFCGWLCLDQEMSCQSWQQIISVYSSMKLRKPIVDDDPYTMESIFVLFLSQELECDIIKDLTMIVVNGSSKYSFFQQKNQN